MVNSSELSVCLLTYNSARTLYPCVEAILQVADEIIVIDSGSTDKTLNILDEFKIKSIFNPYITHANQMNFAISKSKFQWVLCMDSDEIIDKKTIMNINNLKKELNDKSIAYRISRHWHVLGGKPVKNIYPVSSPDYPVRLFNKNNVKFNNAPVDDKPIGFSSTKIIEGYVNHDTFYDLHELLNKLNNYTSRATKYKPSKPSLINAFLNPFPAFIKWYLFKEGYKDGREGFICSIYASLYTFLKYFKSWYLFNKNDMV